MGHDIIINYKCEAFLYYIRKKFMVISCILCKRVHILRIHQYHTRLVRSEVTEENIEILIFSIYCPYAKAEGKQYTKRILPHFVIPECNICLVNVFEFYKVCHTTGKIDYSIAAGILGTVDERTIKRHYTMAASYIPQTTAEIARFLSTIPNLIALPESRPGQKSELELFSQYITLLNLAMEKAGMRTKTEPLIIIQRSYVLQKFRNSCPEIPMNLVGFPACFDDTS